jgi:hypothetical protein
MDQLGMGKFEVHHLQDFDLLALDVNDKHLISIS